ncbi:MAG: MarR family transcriptional regulator [Erysipelotrichaceae bacterium]|nr:MarR family transcriptional regulator [Erysipelotrichaceae bacterium]
MEKGILKEVIRLDHGIKKYMSHGFEVKKGLNLTQFQIVNYLLTHEGEDICQKDLEDLTGLKKASMTGCLNSLEDKDLIYRENAAEDRRRNYIRVTERLKGYGERVAQRGEELEALMLKGIDEKDLEAFYRVAERFVKNIREAEDEADL